MKPRTPRIEGPIQKTRRARALVGELGGLYPDARCSLDFHSPVQLLVATILSAQCTDACVNKVTPALFARFPTASALAAADPGEVEQLVQKTGFFRAKTKNIIRCCQQIVEFHAGETPRTLEELVALAGVGRKTANVVLGHAFGAAGIAVDTHVARLSKRLGLTTSSNPVVIERELGALISRPDWSLFGLRMIYHGRQVCRARKPRCEECSLAPLCPKVGVGKKKASPPGSALAARPPLPSGESRPGATRCCGCPGRAGSAARLAAPTPGRLRGRKTPLRKSS